MKIVFPLMVKVRQIFDQTGIANPAAEVKRQLIEKGLQYKISSGQRIAITAGSRGIANISQILRTVCDEVKAAGGKPFIIPAMGSHGGATYLGQVEVLNTLGISEESLNAPIISSMDVDEIGRIGYTPVFLDKNALAADGIIVVGRIKPHTDFKGDFESGLMKMMAIGLGKQKGAEMIHHNLYKGYHEILPAAARLILKRCKILFGIAVIENARHETAKVEIIEPNHFEEAELRLLKESKSLLARLPFKQIDVLIIEEIGKNISGVGMDTNVIGRFWMPGESDPDVPKINKIVILDLSPETNGNAIGMGLADLITRRVFDKIDYPSTYVNCLTQGTCETGKTPIWLPSDRDVIDTALRLCGPIDRAKANVVLIKNTQELETIMVSKSIAEEIRKDREIKKLELLGEPQELKFDVLGTLIR